MNRYPVGIKPSNHGGSGFQPRSARWQLLARVSYRFSKSQFGVLEALYHLGPMSQNKIGHKILRSSGNMTMVIDNLEKRNLVRRERNQEDRRFFIIHLTAEGNQLISTIFPSHAAEIARQLEVLTPTEQLTLGKLCKKLGLKAGNQTKDP
jgi:MarR family 2-MHQ and catechol resistance regulon transcriptional repressor